MQKLSYLTSQVIILITLLFSLAAADAGMDAAEIYKKSGVTGGLVVVVDCDDGKLAADLSVNERFLVHGLDDDAKDVAKAREKLVKNGQYGKVQISEFDGKNLPYVDSLVSLIVASGKCQVAREEIERVLAPHGVALVGKEKIVKPWPSEIKEWTHFLNDAGGNAVSDDELAGYPRHMRWAASPMWARHHDKLASLSSLVTAKGRLYYVVDRGPVHTPDHTAQWQLEARDAFNGILLWKKPMKSWVSHKRGFRSGPVQLARLLVADGDRIFAAMGINEPVAVINGDDGEMIRNLDATEKAEEILYSDGVLLALIAKESVEHAYNQKADMKEKALTAVDPDNGKVLWRYPKEGFADIIPRTLAASGGKVVLQKTADTVCLDINDGKEDWRVETSPMMKPQPKAPQTEQSKAKRKKKGGSSPSGRKAGWVFNTMVINDGVVLAADGKKLIALSLDGGKKLWETSASTPFGRTPGTDVLVVKGVVWTSPDFSEGRDLKTGKVVTRFDKSEVVTAGHHHRCYRNKGVGDLILYGYRGIEYFDTKGDDHARNNWVRGTCQYGVMPANGLMNVPPHNCGCYPEAMLRGFWALAEDQQGIKVPEGFRGKLIRGQKSEGRSQNSDGWSTYRGNAGRGAIAEKTIAKDPKKIWEAEIGGELTAPVSADGVVLVASKNNHTVYALDEQSGNKLWKFTAGGMVDSPPTIHKGTALFGAADGSVYSLSLKDGALRWRFDAAPGALKSVAFGNVESLWPVKGSILVKNSSTGSGEAIAYFAAGRNTYLDEGIFLFGIDALKGEVEYFTRLQGEHPGASKPGPDSPNRKGYDQNATDYKTFESPDKSDAFSMHGNIGDVMVADDDSIYLRHMRFNDKLERQTTLKHHLFSTSTFVDDNEAHRSHFFFGNGDFSLVPVAYEWITRGSYGAYNIPSAKHMIYDDQTLWAAGHKGVLASSIVGLDEKYEKNFPAEEGKKGGVALWHVSPKMHVRAMLKAADNIILGGSADIGQLMGEVKGGKLEMLSAKDGTQVSSMDLESVPVFAGMAASGGKLLISLQSGKIVCYK